MYGDRCQRRVTNKGVDQLLTAPRSPWQNAYSERVIRSIRRACLNHVIVLSATHLRRLLSSFFHYHHRWRTQMSLAMECRDARPVQPPEQGAVVEFPEVGGLHHHYDQVAA